MELCGYAWLVERFALPAFALVHSSRIGGTRSRTTDAQGRVTEIFPAAYRPGDDPLDHVVFALKVDGVDLALLATLFPHLDPAAVADWVDRRPTGKYARVVGFLYEFLSGRTLPVEDRRAGNYVPVLDPERHVVHPRAARVARWRVVDNLLGSDAFCPVVRRTPGVERALTLAVRDRMEALRRRYPPELFQRTVDYAFYKETRSSFAIEREEVGAQRMERFVALLHEAGSGEAPWSALFAESGLVPLQNAIVDPRYRETRFRTTQNYVGELVGMQGMRVHYVCPPPGQIDRLIRGLAFCAGVEMPPVVKAAVLSFGFVFVHPFEDGNGRLHRFLIHDTLVRTGFVEAGHLLPVSAVMLRERAAYDRALGRFSRPLLALADWSLSPEGEMEVRNPDTLDPWYRFPDLTFAVEYLAPVIEEGVERELADELEFLERHDAARDQVREIVDMPDRRLDLLLSLLRQNGGRLATRKRGLFPELADDEVARIEGAFRAAMA